MSGLGLFFNINTTSLRQQIVPSHMLGRVVSIAGVLAWSAIPLGALLGGWAIEATDDVALVYAVIGALTFVIALAFRFTALGRADDYLAELDDGLAEPESYPTRRSPREGAAERRGVRRERAAACVAHVTDSAALAICSAPT